MQALTVGLIRSPSSRIGVLTSTKKTTIVFWTTHEFLGHGYCRFQDSKKKTTQLNPMRNYVKTVSGQATRLVRLAVRWGGARARRDTHGWILSLNKRWFSVYFSQQWLIFN